MKSSSTPASTVVEPDQATRDPVALTCERLIREQVPNFFRLYLNPFLVQTCLCLDRYVRTTWQTGDEPHPSFLANSFDEALAGAIKLARYSLGAEAASRTGLVLDPAGRLGPFAAVAVPGGRVEFVPGLVVVPDVQSLAAACGSGERFGFVVLVGSPEGALPEAEAALRTLLGTRSLPLITCVDRDTLADCRRGAAGLLGQLTPDVVVFDESFTDNQVPFAAFTARKTLFDLWNVRGKTMFHSTTFQPNAIASLHFQRCLAEADSAFRAGLAAELDQIARDPVCCAALLGTLYSPFLRKTIAALRFATLRIRASGHYIEADGRRVFDGIAGVACSIRGHNPPSYVEELESQGEDVDAATAVAAWLRERTGFEHVLPAVSGANAVENALRLGLVAQYPKRYVLALRNGFGGKTLLALTGTAHDSYKLQIDPLYPHVVYVDPFAPTALADLEAALRRYPVAVVQVELVQAVGGVRALPPAVLEYLEAEKDRWGYLLFVDEVQTGLYRAGPFTLSEQAGVRPDLLTLGKGTSDMMFPFALTLYTAAVRRRLDASESDLPDVLGRRYAYAAGYRTALNVLARAEELHLRARVPEAGATFMRLLSSKLASCRAVRAVRVHGLLIAIELDVARLPARWFPKRWASLYLVSLLRHRAFPLLVGFCQYEPHVLKLTPPLTITPDEVERVCATLAAVLSRPWYRLLPAALFALATR